MEPFLPYQQTLPVKTGSRLEFTSFKCSKDHQIPQRCKISLSSSHIFQRSSFPQAEVIEIRLHGKDTRKILQGFAYLCFDNMYCNKITIKQKQPMPTCTKSGYKWVTVLQDHQLMTEPTLEIESKASHQINVTEMFDCTRYITQWECVNVAENGGTTALLNAEWESLLLHFRVILYQPSPVPKVGLLNIQCTRLPRDDFKSTWNLMGTELCTGDTSNQIIVPQHLQSKSRVEQEAWRLNVATKQLSNSVNKLNALKQRYKDSRWRHDCLKTAIQKNGDLTKVSNLRETPRYQIAMNCLLEH